MTIATLKRMVMAATCLGAMGVTLPAMAADLPEAVPFLADTPYNWTGFYIGAAVGVGSTNTEYSASGPALGGFSASLDSFSGDGFHGALLAGYNHQFIGSNIVVGIEGDVAFNDQDVEADFSAGGGAFTASAELEHDFSASIRGRLGYLLLPRAMAYVTGGLAYGEFDTSASTSTGFSFSQDDSEWGWTIGGGLEVAATDNIRVRAEYLYTDYSEWDYPVPAGFSLDADAVNHTARVGVIYNFNWF